MRSRTTRRFRELLAALPQTVRDQARKAYRQFEENPSHPSLAFKLVHSTRPIYSARIGIGYRALALVEGGIAIWFWIGSHAEYDQILRRL